MSSSRIGSFARFVAVATLAAAVWSGSLEAGPARASAQCMAGSPLCSQVSPTAKGMIGLGLIGAELGFVIPALVQEAAGTNEWWPYLVFPVLGAAGGVVGGYFMEQETVNSPEVDVVFMAIGMALVVPTLVATLALTAYDPGQDAASVGDQGGDEPTYEDETTTEAVQVEDTGGEGEGAPAGDESGGASLMQQRVQALLAGGPGILRFDGHRILLGVPLVRRLPTFTAAESEALHLAPQTDVNIPVLSATF